MEATEQVKVVAAELGVLKETALLMKKQLGELKVTIEESKVGIKLKIEAFLKNVISDVGRRIIQEGMKIKMKQLDVFMRSTDENSIAVVELVEVIDTLLREVHEPPSLVDLAAGRGVEEGLGGGEIPTTLRVKVEGLQEEKVEQARKARDNFAATRSLA